MNQPGQHFQLCILMPCYNNLQGLKKSLQSIKYDKGKYLILIVDDGSEQPFNKEDILHDTNETELPVYIIRLLNNGGITNALNTGLQWIKDNIVCPYVARLDCGDICDPHRFYVQLEYLRVNPYVGLLGSWCWFQKPGKSFKFKYRVPQHHEQIKREMYFRNAFIHPTVIFRFDIVEKLGFYPAEYPHAEDYALFWEIMNVAPTAILPSYLVVCELNGDGISSANRIKQLHSRLVIVRNFGHTFGLKTLGILKIKILMKIPYSFILSAKKLM
ncbi:MAG: glycosyl transferase family 2 [Chitinophagaceae bacterium]|nr:glycosyl transferase family 2 [Chitinophagaceae bacterium]